MRICFCECEYCIRDCCIRDYCIGDYFIGDYCIRVWYIRGKKGEEGEIIDVERREGREERGCDREME